MEHGFRLTLAYEGTSFAGWQSQPGQRTVQGELERALETLVRHPVRVRGASRTDSGVHALGQCVAFETTLALPAHGVVAGLNRLLPADMAVRHAEPCEVGYQPRFDATGKTYRYTIAIGRTRNPLLARRAWFVGPSLAKPGPAVHERSDRLEEWLDVGAMQEAARALVGTHDYRAFCSADEHRTTVRTIHAVRMDASELEGDTCLTVEVRGSAFLKHMVRIIVGTLVDVGRGRIDARTFGALLGAHAQRADAGQTAPAHGLTLVEVRLGRGRGETPT